MNLNNLVVLVITVYFISSIIWHFVWVIIITNNIPVSLWCCRYDHSHFDGTHCSPDQCRLSSVAVRWVTDVFFQMETGDSLLDEWVMCFSRWKLVTRPWTLYTEDFSLVLFKEFTVRRALRCQVTIIIGLMMFCHTEALYYTADGADLF